MRSEPLAVRFERLYIPEPNSGCWLWIGALKNGRYGSITLGRRSLCAHRVSWQLHKGDIDGLHVLHRCDNTFCVNPDHLFLGTHDDNMADKVKKGRSRSRVFGEASPNAKLNRAQVMAIRSDSRPSRTVALEYGISGCHAHKIRQRKVWSHLS